MIEIAVVALGVGGCAAVLFLVLVFAWFLDRWPREPIYLVSLFFGWGLVVGSLLTRWTFFLTVVDEKSLNQWLSALWPGLIILAPLLVMTIGLRSFDCPSDGLVYGCAVGLGFCGGCFVACGAQTLSANSYGLSTLLIVLTAIAVYGSVIGLSAMTRRRISRYILGGLAVIPFFAVLVTGLLAQKWATRTTASHIDWWISGIAVLLLLLLVSLVYYAEHRIISVVVNEEADLKVLPDWTVDIIGSYRKRIRGNWWPIRRERTVISRVISRLAFRKRALSDLAQASGDVAWIEIVLLRKEIKKIFEISSNELE